jgi:hypothetical protein
MGHLHVAKWLFSVGAAHDIFTPNNFGNAPLSVACAMGHVHIARWLILKGAANSFIEIAGGGKDGSCGGAQQETSVPLSVPSSPPTDLGQPARRVNSGHVCGQVLLRSVGEESRRDVWLSLQHLVLGNYCFVGLILPSVSLGFRPAPPLESPPTLLLTDSAASSSSQSASSHPSSDGENIHVSKRANHAQTGATDVCYLGLLCGHEGTVLHNIADFVGVERGRRLRIAREALGCFAANPPPQYAFY